MSRISSGKFLAVTLLPQMLTHVIQELVPALVQSVKSSGLILVSQGAATAADTVVDAWGGAAQGKKLEGVDGVLMGGVVLQFEETIEM